jgi:WD domain, G-beta repeat
MLGAGSRSVSCASSPDSDSDSGSDPHTESDTTSQSSSSPRQTGSDAQHEPGAGESPPLKRRRMAAEVLGEATAQAPGIVFQPPRFRHIGFVRQTAAACLFFCFEQLCLRARERSPGGRQLQLSDLPPELVQVICRHAVLGTAMVKFPRPDLLERVATLPEPWEHGSSSPSESGSDEDSDDYEEHVLAVTCFHLPDGGQILASGGHDCVVTLWDLPSGECVALLEGHTARVRCLVSYAEADGIPVLASGSFDSTIILWDVLEHKQIAKLASSDATVHCILALVVFTDFSGLPCLASAGSRSDGAILLWNPRSRTVSSVLQGHRDTICDICAIDGPSRTDFLASGCVDGSIRVWDLATRLTVVYLQAPSCVNSLTSFMGVDGVRMLVSGSIHVIQVWNLASSVEIMSMANSPQNLRCFAASMECAAGVDGRVLLICAFVGGAAGVHIIDLSTERRPFMVASTQSCVATAFCDRATGAPFLATSVCEPDAASSVQLWTSPLS